MPGISSFGTKLFVNALGMVRIVPPDKTKGYISQSDEKELYGITRLSIHFPLPGIIKADIECHCFVNTVEAVPHYFLQHPETGEMEEIQFIQFKSGKEWEVKRVPEGE